MTEIPWPTDKLLPAKLMKVSSLRDDVWIFRFKGPDDHLAHICVTQGQDTQIGQTNVWHYDISGDKITISPSIHFINHFHSPNPVTFQLVEELNFPDA